MKAPLAIASFLVTGLAAAQPPADTAPSHAPPLDELAAPSELESASASPAGERVLRMARRMVRNRTIVRGSCYDYIERVFRRAGFPAGRRERVFTSPPEGPYADLALIAPGDWLFLVSRPDLDPPLTHSVIFVRWLDRAAGRAEVVSYAGGDARRPGGLVPYDLTRTYVIARARARR